MAADEHQAQDVVAVVLLVQPIGQSLFGVVEVGDVGLIRQRLGVGLTADAVDAGVARATMISQGGGVSRGARSAARSGAPLRHASWNASSATSRSRK